MEEHRGAFEYDWRTRFGMSLAESVPAVMGWGEAYRLTEKLAADPSSQVAAAIAGWERPATFTELVLLDLFDMQYASKAKTKPKPLPRPWKNASKGQQAFGPVTSMTIPEFEAMKERLAIEQLDDSEGGEDV